MIVDVLIIANMKWSTPLELHAFVCAVFGGMNNSIVKPSPIPLRFDSTKENENEKSCFYLLTLASSSSQSTCHEFSRVETVT